MTSSLVFYSFILFVLLPPLCVSLCCLFSVFFSIFLLLFVFGVCSVVFDDFVTSRQQNGENLWSEGEWGLM